jgi:formylglycine-generating enzyme required for sulfatase activity
MTIEGMQFCYVPPGSFWMGEGREEHLNEHLNYGYWLARFPVTVAQFRAFVKESGFKPNDPDSLQGMDNHPVVWVSWHEALAFCEWLAQGWRDWLPARWSVRLPTEAEWEKAARGGLEIPVRFVVSTLANLLETDFRCQSNRNPKRRYPWGDEPDAERANYSDTRIGATSAVGCFPGGASSYGVEDLSGNVWEWTQSIYEDYPYDPEDGRENLEASDEVRRVLRGGSFFSDQDLVRCAVRGRGLPADSLRRLRGSGCRVVVAPVDL